MTDDKAREEFSAKYRENNACNYSEHSMQEMLRIREDGKFAFQKTELFFHYWQAAKELYAPRWISVEDDKPKSGQSVLVSYTNKLGNRRVVVGKYMARYSVESNGECDQHDEYCEEQDCYYLCEGWYENQDNWDDYASIFIHEGNVDLWMPLIIPSEAETKAIIAAKAMDIGESE